MDTAHQRRCSSARFPFVCLMLVGFIVGMQYEAAEAYPTAPAEEVYYNGGSLQFQLLLSDSDYTNQVYLQTPTALVFLGVNSNTGSIIDLLDPGAVGLKVGDEFILVIRVLNTGDSFVSNSATDNPDRIAHAVITYPGNQTAIFEFEDLFGGGDRDFNDARIKVLGNIGFAQIGEAPSLLLYGLGIALFSFLWPLR